MKTVVMSSQYPCFCSALAAHGYQILPTENSTCFLEPERRHADMQLLNICGKIFRLADCRRAAGESYPDNVRLNCLLFDGTLYGNLGAVDDAVLEHCRENGIRTVHVNQGYARCSTLPLRDRAAITADRGIAGALMKNGAEVLLIEPGHIRLEGFDYGFIGGASFAVDDSIFFFGAVKKHPDYERIRAFCNRYHSKIEILCGEEPLTDIGGAVML